MFHRTAASISRLSAPKIGASSQARQISWNVDYRKNVTLTSQSGVDILHDPMLNKGTAFSTTERDRLFLRGLLPPAVKDMDLQMMRNRVAFDVLSDDLEKHQFLVQMQDRNETLFYQFIMTYLKEMAPIIYTPTVGRACQEFAVKFRRPRGMYFTCEDKGEMRAMTYNWPVQEVDVIVVTDGGRILGLGDLGANGMGIPIGKLSLYVAAGGFNPGRTLPVMFDVGTNNEELRNSPFYLGVNRERVSGSEYYELITEFMEAVTERWPNAIVQFEDFTPDKAQNVLAMFRDKYRCFNDDIQGTGSVVVAGVLNTLRVKGLHFSDLRNQKILIAGAGSAGVGVADALCMAMVQEGISEEQALKNLYLVDYHGLITHKRERTTTYQKRYAKARDDQPEGISLLETITRVKPDILLGVSGVGGLFTEDVLREMGRVKTRPIIFPLSNPTSKSECTALDAFKSTDGRAVFASGSPFAHVKLDGKVYHTSQSNNMYIYPGVGLGTLLSGASHVTDQMFYEASKALASSLKPDDLQHGRVYPGIERIREVSVTIAAKVIEQTIKEGQAKHYRRLHLSNLEGYVRSHMWEPRYTPIILNSM